MIPRRIDQLIQREVPVKPIPIGKSSDQLVAVRALRFRPTFHPQHRRVFIGAAQAKDQRVRHLVTVKFREGGRIAFS